MHRTLDSSYSLGAVFLVGEKPGRIYLTIECRGCGGEPAHPKEWCDVCLLLVPIITGESTSSIARGPTIDEIRELIGETGGSTRKIWSAIRSLPDPNATSWIRKEKSTPSTLDLGIPLRNWELEEDDLRLLDTNLRDPVGAENAQSYDRTQLRRLQRGGYLPDGSFLSYSSGRWTLDGRWIQLPYRGLSKMLSRKRGMDGIDWRSLLYSIDWAVRSTATYYPWEGPGGNGNRMVHPVHDRLFPQRRNGGGAFDRLFNRSINRILGASIPEVADVSGSEWLTRWEEVHKGSRTPISSREQLIPVSMDIHRGRLRLRVRRDAGWRRIVLDSHPDVWAKILTWALSPNKHADREKLTCLQQFLFTSSDSPLISGPDRRGITLLRGVIESTELAEVDHESRTISVAGTSGLCYSVNPKEGSHTHNAFGARFTVSPLGISSSQLRREYRRMSRICIVETQELRRLVIGDALSSVVLALLNDLVSQRQIDTLRRHIRSFSPEPAHRADPDVEHMREARWLNMRAGRNPINSRIRRYTNLFPRLWGAILRSPLGARVTLTAMSPRRPNLTFDDSETRFSTTCMADRQIVKGMLEASGWVRDREEESVRGTREIYFRTGTGPRDLGPAVEGLCETIEPVLTAGTVRMIEAPLWHYFERDNPGPGPLLPETDQIIE